MLRNKQLMLKRVGGGNGQGLRKAYRLKRAAHYEMKKALARHDEAESMMEEAGGLKCKLLSIYGLRVPYQHDNYRVTLEFDITVMQQSQAARELMRDTIIEEFESNISKGKPFSTLEG